MFIKVYSRRICKTISTIELKTKASVTRNDLYAACRLLLAENWVSATMLHGCVMLQDARHIYGVDISSFVLLRNVTRRGLLAVILIAVLTSVTTLNKAV